MTLPKIARRDKIVGVRFSKEDLTKLKKAAMKSKMHMSSYIYTTVMNSAGASK